MPPAKAARRVLTMIYTPGIPGLDLHDVHQFFAGGREAVHYRYFEGDVEAVAKTVSRTLWSWVTDGTAGKHFQRAALIVLNSRAPGPMWALFKHVKRVATDEITLFMTTALHLREGDQEVTTDRWADLYFSSAWQRPDDSGRFMLADETG